MLLAMKFTRLSTDYHGFNQRAYVYSCSIVDPNSSNRPSTPLIFKLVVFEDKKESLERYFLDREVEIEDRPGELFDKYLFFKLCKEAIKRRKGGGWRPRDIPYEVQVSNFYDLDDFVNDPSKQIAPPQGRGEVIEVPFEIEE